MRYLIGCVIMMAVLPQGVAAQFVESFTIETEITEENSSGTSTPSGGGGGQSGTRVDRDEDGETRVAPPNVRNIRITPTGDTLRIEWDNPAVAFASIRVVRGDFFAKDIYDGWSIFSDRGEVVSDIRPGEAGVFYTFFVVMPDGLTSSGVSTFYKETPPKESAVVPVTPSVPVAPIDPSLPPAPTPSTTPEVWEQFLLDGAEYGGMIRAVDDRFVTPFSAAKDLTFVVPAYAIPVHIKSVVVTLENKTTGVLERFLLRRTGNEFIAQVPRRLVAGEYSVIIDLYDFDAINRLRHERTIDIYPHYFVTKSAEEGRVLLADYIVVVYGVLLLFLGAFFWRLWRVIKRPAV